MSLTIEVTSADGIFKAYLATPRIHPAPAIVVLHEVFGVNNDLRATCDELAERGYFAVSPDLFWRQEPGVDLSHWTETEWKKGLSLYNAFDYDKGISDIVDTLKTARKLNNTTGRVGVTGFCMGGLLTLLTAARGFADAAVAYYPGGAEKYLQGTAALSIPMLVHLGEEDEYISKDAQRKIADAFSDNARVVIHSYPRCSHAFARHSGDHFDRSAAALANGRTWAFFDTYLR